MMSMILKRYHFIINSCANLHILESVDCAIVRGMSIELMRNYVKCKNCHLTVHSIRITMFVKFDESQTSEIHARDSNSLATWPTARYVASCIANPGMLPTDILVTAMAATVKEQYTAPRVHDSTISVCSFVREFQF